MNVSLTPELERFIAEQVESGRYRSASEVVREAIRLLQTSVAERETRLAALRRAIETGAVELDRGDGIPAEDVFKAILDSLNRSEAA